MQIKPIGCINRIPKKGDFRSNLALGGEAFECSLSDKEKNICVELSNHLVEEGLFFVGIDVIHEMLSEINVTSPTGLREIEKLSNKSVSDEVIDILLNNIDQIIYTKTCFTNDSNFSLISSISSSQTEPLTIPEPAVNSI